MRVSTLKKLVVGIALIGASGVASASTHYLGTITDTTSLTYSQSGLSGAFNETFSFTFGPVPVAGIRGNFSATGLYGVISIDPSYSQTIGGYTTPYVHLFNFDTATPHVGYLNYDQTTHSFAFADNVPLQWIPGSTLSLNLTGDLGTSTNAAFNLTLAPVPEPESYAMMLAGLGLMCMIARRRSKIVG